MGRGARSGRCAGKPVFTRHGEEGELAGFTALVQALVSFARDRGDSIRTIRCPATPPPRHPAPTPRRSQASLPGGEGRPGPLGVAVTSHRPGCRPCRLPSLPAEAGVSIAATVGQHSAPPGRSRLSDPAVHASLACPGHQLQATQTASNSVAINSLSLCFALQDRQCAIQALQPRVPSALVVTRQEQQRGGGGGGVQSDPVCGRGCARAGRGGTWWWWRSGGRCCSWRCRRGGRRRRRWRPAWTCCTASSPSSSPTPSTACSPATRATTGRTCWVILPWRLCCQPHAEFMSYVDCAATGSARLPPSPGAVTMQLLCACSSDVRALQRLAALKLPWLPSMRGHVDSMRGRQKHTCRGWQLRSRRRDPFSLTRWTCVQWAHQRC